MPISMRIPLLVDQGGTGGVTAAAAIAALLPVMGISWSCVGSLMLLRHSSGGAVAPGAYMSGASLECSNAGGVCAGGTMPGTWFCLGYGPIGSDTQRTTLWLRTS